jgi:hypothetical protein
LACKSSLLASTGCLRLLSSLNSKLKPSDLFYEFDDLLFNTNLFLSIFFALVVYLYELHIVSFTSRLGSDVTVPKNSLLNKIS